MTFLTIRKKFKWKLKNICVSLPPYIRHSPSLWKNQRPVGNLFVSLASGSASGAGTLPLPRVPLSAPCLVRDLTSPCLSTHKPFLGANEGPCAGDQRAESDPTVLLCRSSSQLQGSDKAGTGIDNRMTAGQELQTQKHLTQLTTPPSPLPLLASRLSFLPSLSEPLF